MNDVGWHPNLVGEACVATLSSGTKGTDAGGISCVHVHTQNMIGIGLAAVELWVSYGAHQAHSEICSCPTMLLYASVPFSCAI